MSGPARIRRRREKGWTMPEGAVYVGRGSKWGNPFKLNDDMTGLCRVPAALEKPAAWEYEGRISGDGTSHAYFHPSPAPGIPMPVTYCEVRYMTRAEIVELYKRCLLGDVPPAVVAAYGRRNPVGVTVDQVRAELAGKTLACWCHIDDECHADVLLEIANPAPAAPVSRGNFDARSTVFQS